MTALKIETSLEAEPKRESEPDFTESKRSGFVHDSIIPFQVKPRDSVVSVLSTLCGARH